MRVPLEEIKVARQLLDEQDSIKAIDKNGMINFCVDIVMHYQNAFETAKNIKVDYTKPENVIVAGMGGSAIGGDLLKDWAKTKCKVPIEVCRDYQLPAYANQKTLVIIASYSGDTEETLSAFLDALKRGCMMFCVSSGGALLKFAERQNIPFVRVSAGMPPRAALPYMLVPMLVCMYKIGLTNDFSQEFKEALEVLAQVANDNSPQTRADSNFAKALAIGIGNSSPLIYGFSFFRSVAQRFKQQFNENSKIPAKWEFFPELNHNEIVGWENASDLSRDFCVVFIRDIDESLEIHSRIETTKKLMKPSAIPLLEVYSHGKTALAKMLSTICIGDFASVYLAILHGVDPTPVQTINKLKDALIKNGIKNRIIKDLEKF
jgi:glucose/mannose-6-phosphate isomerase